MSIWNHRSVAIVAGASKKLVRRTTLIGSCAPCDSVPKSKLEERSWLVWHEPLWALKLTYIEEFFSFARVLRHFVLVPCEICVVPYGHWKIATDWNDVPLANRENKVESLIHACASLCSFKHGYLSLQKYSLQQYFIKKLPLPILLHNCRFYPQSTSWLHQLVDTPRHKRA